MAAGNGTGATAPWLLQQPPAVLGRIVAAMPLGVVVFDADGHLVHANSGAVALLGLDAERMAAAAAADLFGIADRRGAPVTAVPGEQVERLVRRVVRPDGSEALVELLVSRVDERVAAFLRELPAAASVGTAGGVGRPGHVASHPLLHAQVEVLRLVATSAPHEEALAAVVRLADEQLPGTSSSIVLRDGAGSSESTTVIGAPLGDDLRAALDDHGPLPADATVVPIRAAAAPGGDPAPELDGDGVPDAEVLLVTRGVGALAPEAAAVLSIAADLAAIAVVSDRDQQDLARRAFHDELTGLANRNLLLDRLAQALNRARRRGRPLALMFVDLDRFKLINDTFGHDVGDLVLQQFAERLRQTVRPEDTVARFGGDEFVVLIEQITGEHDVDVIADRLEQRVAEPFDVGGRQLQVTASVGLVVAAGDDLDHVLSHDGDGRLGEDLLRDADAAMYRAKQLGRNRRELFDAELRARQLERARLATDLRAALGGDTLVLHYQPIVDLTSGRVGMVEALLRWEHPVRGLLHAGAFLPAADELGLLPELGDWVLRRAASDLAGFESAGLAGGAELSLALNVSGRQLGRAGVVDAVAETLAQAGIAPTRLTIEVPEEVVGDTNPAVVDGLRGLRALGIGVAIDDFGTGSTAVASLRRGDVDLVKLDRRYVASLGTSSRVADRPPDDRVAHAVVAMAHALGIGVVAEGVEDDRQLAALRALGCDLAQGTLFAPPLPLAPLVEALRRTTRW